MFLFFLCVSLDNNTKSEDIIIQCKWTFTMRILQRVIYLHTFPRILLIKFLTIMIFNDFICVFSFIFKFIEHKTVITMSVWSLELNNLLHF